MFWLLIERFLIDPRQVLKSQIVARALLKSNHLAAKTLIAQAILDLVDDQQTHKA